MRRYQVWLVPAYEAQGYFGGLDPFARAEATSVGDCGWSLGRVRTRANEAARCSGRDLGESLEGDF